MWTQTNGWILRIQHFWPLNYSRCLNFWNFKLALPWPRITLLEHQNMLYESLNIIPEQRGSRKSKVHCFRGSFLHICSFSLLIFDFIIFVMFFCVPEAFYLSKMMLFNLWDIPEEPGSDLEWIWETSVFWWFFSKFSSKWWPRALLSPVQKQ